MTKSFGSTGEVSTIRLWTIGACLVAFQIPFVLTQHIQEDAYITFRCALNLAATGVYGYNPGERVSASTAHLSVVIAAALRWLSGDMFIRLLQLLYGAATVAGTYLVIASIVAERRQRLRIWSVVCVLPASLVIAYGGMESALVILLFGVILRRAVLSRFDGWCAAAFFLLPWTRPDAIAIGIIVLIVSTWPGRALAWNAAAYAALLLAGLVSWALFNRVYFGAFLTQSIISKAVVWMPSATDDVIRRGLRATWRIVAGDAGMPGLFVPIETKYLHRLAIPSFVLTLTVAVVMCARRDRDPSRRAALMALALTTVLPPVAYAFGGVLASWYFWPSRFAAYVLIAAAVVEALEHQSGRIKQVMSWAAIGAVVLLAVGQWCFAVAWGTQERLYRGGIGQQIRSLSAPDDTLLLEPAGYIPFYAERRTWDEIGITSPAVTTYRRTHGERWWIEFVKDVSPTLILERERMRAHVTLDGYQLTADEASWFDRHYSLVRTFAYDPQSLRSSTVLARIASFSNANAYLLYRRVRSSDAAAMNTNHAANVP